MKTQKFEAILVTYSSSNDTSSSHQNGLEDKAVLSWVTHWVYR